MVDENRPVVYVNDENSFMSTWPSESIAGNDLPPECMFWNQSVVFSDEMCSLFVVNRAASAYSSASARAMRCAAEFGVECVLSPEIGLAMPAAFLYDYETSSMRMLIAPKLVPHESEQLHVRVSPPDSMALHRRGRLFSTTRFAWSTSMGRVRPLERATYAMGRRTACSCSDNRSNRRVGRRWIER